MSVHMEIIIMQQNQIAELQRQNIELRKLPDLMGRWFSLMRANPKYDFYINVSSLQFWNAGFASHRDIDDRASMERGTLEEVLQWVLDNFEGEA